jgi:hypothetical protein
VRGFLFGKLVWQKDLDALEPRELFLFKLCYEQSVSGRNQFLATRWLHELQGELTTISKGASLVRDKTTRDFCLPGQNGSHENLLYDLVRC